MCISGVREPWMSWPIRPSRTERFEEYCVTARLPGASPAASDVEEHGLALALKTDVERVDGGAVALGAAGEQGRAPDGRLDHVEDRVFGVGVGLVGEVDPCREPDVDPARREPHVDVRRHRLSPVPARHPAPPDGLAAVEARLEI